MLVYCCAGGLLSKLISRGSWPDVGNFSLVVICTLLSNCGRGLQANCDVHGVLELW